MNQNLSFNPYDSIKIVPSFSLTSIDIVSGKKLNLAQVSGILGAGGKDISPQLSWSDFPTETKSFAITAFDPDAPTAAGFWHWAVANIPLEITTIPAGVGNSNSNFFTDPVINLKNDASLPGYIGAAPPIGHGAHRYYFAVHAVAVTRLDLTPNSTPTALAFQLFSNCIARGTIYATYARTS